MKRLIKNVIILVCTGLNVLPVQAQSPTVKIGVLAPVGKAEALKNWMPTATYLSARSDRHSYEIIPLNYEEVVPAVANREVEFILANPAYYVQLEEQYEVTRIASIVRRTYSGLSSQYGSVILTRADNDAIETLSDLKRKRFVAVHPRAFGGWIMALHTLKEHNIDPKHHLASLSFAGTADSVLSAILSGAADAGCIRTQILTDLAMRGQININQFKVISSHVDFDSYPFVSSTQLYPEWPLAKVNHVPDYRAKTVASLLLSMPSDHPAAYESNIGGWTVPMNYHSVKVCLQDLRLPPYENFGKITIRSLFNQFKYWILAVLLLVTVFITEALKTININIALRKSQEELTESESRFRIISQSAHDAIVMIDDTGCITYWNSAAQQLFGYSEAEMMGMDMHQLLAPEERRNESLIGMNRFRETGQGPVVGQTLELEAFDKQGRLFPVELSVSAVRYGGRWYAIGILRDIEKRKRHESELKEARDLAESANRAKSIFLASMSHEIRTPMNAILGFTEIMQSRTTQPELHHYLENIEASGKALLSLINDILDLSKIEAGRLDLQKQVVNINDIFKEILQIFSWKAETKKLDFSFEVDQNLPHSLLMDAVRIRQILLNLVGNAVKFTDAGSITLRARKLAISDDASQVELLLSVEDTGIGIPRSQQEIIFEAFRQRTGQNTAQYGGTGLGLAITKQLVEMMNGQISVKSQPGSGSTFTVQLKNVPVASDISVQRDLYPQSINLDHIEFEPCTLLVVDDISMNRELVLTYLKSFPINMIEASNGREALSLTQKTRPDCILMDMKMPEMDGYEATRQLKSNPATAAIPVIALTASILQEAIDVIKDAGCDDILQKPVSRQDLILVLAQYLPNHHKAVSETPVMQPAKPAALDFDTLQPEERSRLYHSLKQHAWPIYQEVEKTFIFDSIELLADELDRIATKHSSTSLAQYASELHHQCQHFEMDKLPITLNQLPDFINRLANDTKESSS